MRRAPHRVLNRKALEALIKVGALERFGERRVMLENIETMLLFNKQAELRRQQNQGSLFDLAPGLGQETLSLKPTTPASRLERLVWERELLGLYVSAHPMTPFL